MSFFWGKVELSKWYGRFLGWWWQGRYDFVDVREMAREGMGRGNGGGCGRYGLFLRIRYRCPFSGGR